MFDSKKPAVVVDGFLFETDDADGLGLRNGAPFEPEVLSSLRRHIKSGELVLDVGANVGYFSAFMSQLVGIGGEVHSYEPEPRNFSLLQRNIEVNRLTNVTPYMIALGDHQYVGNLHLSDFNGGMHRLYDSFCCGDSVVSVPVQRLDSIYQPGQVSAIKLDVEGFEPFVIAGARGIIKGQAITLIAEYCPPSMLEAGAGVVSFLEDLVQLGLSPFDTSGSSIEWSLLFDDARRWDKFGRDKLLSECSGKTNPEIANIVDLHSRKIGCARPYIENLVFLSI